LVDYHGLEFVTYSFIGLSTTSIPYNFDIVTTNSTSLGAAVVVSVDNYSLFSFGSCSYFSFSTYSHSGVCTYQSPSDKALHSFLAFSSSSSCYCFSFFYSCCCYCCFGLLVVFHFHLYDSFTDCFFTRTGFYFSYEFSSYFPSYFSAASNHSCSNDSFYP